VAVVSQQVQELDGCKEYHKRDHVGVNFVRREQHRKADKKEGIIAQVFHSRVNTYHVDKVQSNGHECEKDLQKIYQIPKFPEECQPLMVHAFDNFVKQEQYDQSNYKLRG